MAAAPPPGPSEPPPRRARPRRPGARALDPSGHLDRHRPPHAPARVCSRWTSSARGRTTASVEALPGTAQVTATVAPNGRSSTIAPAAPLSVSVSPPLVSTRAPAGGGAVDAGQARQGRHRELRNRQLGVGAVEAHALGYPAERLRAGLGHHAAHHARHVGEDPRERAHQRIGGADADADAAQLFEVNRAAARHQRAGRLIDVAEHATLVGRRGREGIHQAEDVFPVGAGGGGAESQHRDGGRLVGRHVEAHRELGGGGADGGLGVGGVRAAVAAGHKKPAATSAARRRARISARRRGIGIDRTQHYNVDRRNSPIGSGKP